MKQIKKVAVSKIDPADGAVVDSFSASVDKTTNAPSIRAVEELLENYTPSGGASVLETNPIGAILEWPSDTIPTNWLLCNGQAVSRTEYSELFKVIGTTYGAGDGSTTFNVPDRRGNTAIGKDDSDTDFNTLGKTGGAKKRTLVLANIPSHTHTFTGTAHTHTLNGHTHSVGAHSHGLNSHTHSIPALSGTAKSAGSHSHSVRSLANAANTGGNNYLREWSKSGDTATDGVGSAGAHTHSVTTTASTTGKASGSTANSSAFNTGANSGNTSSTTATGTIGAAGSGTEFDIMNPHIVQNFIIKAKETAAVIAKVEDSLTSDSTTDALSAAQGKKLKELIDNLPNSEIQGTGAPEIAIGPDEPTGEEVLWIDDEYDIDPDDIDLSHSIIMGTLSNDLSFSASTDYTKLPLDTFTTIGTKLISTDDGGILINKDVNFIKINGSITIGSGNKQSAHIRIVKGTDVSADNTLAWVCTTTSTDWFDTTFDITNVIGKVSKRRHYIRILLS